jgi:hypothetical protein
VISRRGGKSANISPERIGDLVSPDRENNSLQVNMFLSNEKYFTIRYKASARHFGNFGRIDSSFDARGFEANKV